MLGSNKLQKDEFKNGGVNPIASSLGAQEVDLRQRHARRVADRREVFRPEESRYIARRLL